MGIKEAISGDYIENWHHRTKNWHMPDSRFRSAVVIGSDRVNNIGAQIAKSLKLDVDPSFQTVAERDIESLDLMLTADRNRFRWDEYDTAIFCNGMTNLSWIENQTNRAIRDVVDNKLTASILGVQAFVSRTIDMPVTKNIVLIGSMAAGSVLNGSAPYCAASAGLQHFARCAAWELAPKGYRVFLVNPSNTEGTPMTEETIRGLECYRDLTRQEAEDYWGATRALPRWLQPEEIGSIVSWLITTPEAEWLSGTPLNLGGGLR